MRWRLRCFDERGFVEEGGGAVCHRWLFGTRSSSFATFDTKSSFQIPQSQRKLEKGVRCFRGRIIIFESRRTEDWGVGVRDEGIHRL